ncbi:MAG: universal stress protein [Chlorobi bacterium]|nr:universal stress protein [Chlorobiota bacterium]
MIKKNIQNILVPVLFTAESQILLKQAMYFHEVFSSRITLLYVVPKVSFLRRMLQPKKFNPLKARQEALSKLTHCANVFFDEEIPNFIDIKIVEGELVTEILKMLKTHKFDLIIIKEYSKIKCLLNKLKVEAEKIVSGAECPVMIIHEKWTKTGIKEILVPIDVTQKCKNVVLWAAAISHKLKARIQIVSIVDLNINVEKSLVKKRANLIKNWITKQGIECDLNILRSAPKKMHDALLSFADQGNADLIMILTHEEFILANNYLSKFAKEVIHRSPKPVLSVVLHDKPMFNVVWDSYKYGRTERIEHLNITEDDIKN